LKVLYVIGWGRSGSTILDNLLGQLDGFFSTGELRNIWQEGLVEDRKCGCGAPVEECQVWSRVLNDAFGPPGTRTVEPATVIEWERRALRGRHTFRLDRAVRDWNKSSPELRAYASVAAALYRQVASTTGARVIVDSSKVPANAFLLRALPSVDPFYIHLVRDPRATAYSWGKIKARLDRDEVESMPRFGIVKNALNWNQFNAAAELLGRRSPGRVLLLRYEDFIAQPRMSMKRIVDLVGEACADLPFRGASTVSLTQTHTVSGNPSRFRTGEIELKEDREWLTEQRWLERLAVTVLTGPLLGRYGYKWRLGRSQGRRGFRADAG
jgi:Sulfotransferase family